MSLGFSAGIAIALAFWFLSHWWAAIVSTLVNIIFFKIKKNRKVPPFSGHVEPGWEKVKETYRKLIEDGVELGSAFAVYYKGQLVVDLWGGYSDVEADRPWSHDTLAATWSCTKGMCAIAVADLYDKGLLDYGEPVARYWPDFAQNGKEAITVEQLMSHQAGLIIPDEPYRVGLVVEDPEELGRFLAKQSTNWKPGSAHGYHALTYGLLVDQLIRHVDAEQRCLKDYFQQEICDRIGAEYHIGLPTELSHRCVRLQPVDFGWRYTLFELIPFLISVIPYYVKHILAGNNFLLKTLNCSDWKDWDTYIMNNVDFRSLPIGSTHGFSSARDMARIYSALINSRQMLGYDMFQQQTVDYLGTLISEGPDKLCVKHARWGPGTMIFPSEAWPYPGFGHLGLGGQFALCDQQRNLAWSYCTNQMNGMSLAILDKRYRTLRDAMLDCVEELTTSD